VTKANRDRGVLTERKVANYLRGHGFPNAERAVKTGLKTIDREVADPGDITGTPGLVWQVKALRPLVRAEREVVPWMRETERQRADANADLGILVVRRDQRPEPEWFAYLPVADLCGRIGGAYPAGLVELLHDRDALVVIPARLYLGDLVTLLRAQGWGTPATEPPGTDSPVALTALP
jgi:hypothetical protein